MPSPSPDLPGSQPLAGQLVVFTGKLSSLSRKQARTLVTRLGGATADDPNARTTMLVVGAEGFGPESAPPPDPAGPSSVSDSVDGSAASGISRPADPSAGSVLSRTTRETSSKLRRAEELNAQRLAWIHIVTEDEFCGLVGLPTPEALKRQYHAMRDLAARYPLLREDHLKYLVKCGVIQPVVQTNADTFFAFPDLAAIKQAHDGLAEGLSFQAVVRTLIASRHGQLAFDFRLDAAPAKILTLSRPAAHGSRPAQAAAGSLSNGARDRALAEDYFAAASELDDGDESKMDEAATVYRRALELDPCLVPALINLANIHYRRDEVAEAQALYERAIDLEGDFFEAHFNLGNIFHDLGRFQEAQTCYREALRLNPSYADAHFYLAVTFEKMGQSPEAQPHWRAYRQLAPEGEWVELAREFSD